MRFRSKKKSSTALSVVNTSSGKNEPVQYTVDWTAFLESAIEEAVRNFVPNMRLQRIVAVLKSILSKISIEEQARINFNSANPEHKAVLEQAFALALNTVSDAKHKAAAQIIIYAMKDTRDNCVNYIRFLHLLNQLDDIDLIILRYRVYTKYYPSKALAYFEKRSDKLLAPGEDESNSRKAIYNHRLVMLRNLGFFTTKKYYGNPNKPEGQDTLKVEPIAKYFVFAIGDDFE